MDYALEPAGGQKTPAAPDSDRMAEIAQQAARLYREAVDADTDNREWQAMDLRALAGDQWEDAARQAREAEGRPCLVFDRLGQAVRRVAGNMAMNPPGIRARPKGGQNDKQVAEIVQGLIRDIEDRSDAQAAYVLAGTSAVSCGTGNLRVTMCDVDDDTFDKDLVISAVRNPFAVVWDPAAVEPTRSDARHAFEIERLTADQFKKEHPKANPSGFDADNPDKLASLWVGWSGPEWVQRARFWIKQDDTHDIVELVDGTVMRADKWEKVSEEQRLPMRRRKTRKGTKVVCYLIGAGQVLSGPHEWPGQHIPLVHVCGEEIFNGETRVRRGVVRLGIAPQQLYNYLKTTELEMLGDAPKAPWLLTPKQIEGYEPMWNRANVERRPYLLYNPDPETPQGQPKRQAPPIPNVALAQAALAAADDIKAGTGIYDASLGARSNETSAVAIRERKAESDAGTYHYVDHLRAAVRQVGLILVDMIPKIYDGERIIRVLDEDGVTARMEVINKAVRAPDGSILYKNDLTVGRYDVSVTTGPAYATRRAAASDAMNELLRASPEVFGQIADIYFQTQDWPMAEKIAERLKPPGADPENPPPPDPMQELALRRAAAETESVELDNAGKELELAQAVVGIQQAMQAMAAQQQATSLALQTIMGLLGPGNPGGGQGAPQPMAPQPMPGMPPQPPQTAPLN